MVTYVTDILTATPAYVSASPTSTRAWQWLRGSTTVAGATTNSYTVTAADLGQPITVNQTETNFLGTASATSVADGVVNPFAPAALFALNEPGVWYDPSDITTLYTDNIGTTPVTAPGQTVGLVLDKSKGEPQALPLTGWSKNSGDGVVTINGNVITITGATTTTRVDIISHGWQIGDFIKMTVDASISSATGALAYMGVGSPFFLQAGVSTYSALSTGTLLRLQITTGSATFTVTSRSRTPGNHATQSILGQRPIYGIVPKNGRRNLLTQTEAFDETVWTKSGVSLSVGSSAASRVVTATTANGSIYQFGTVSPSGATCTNSVEIRRVTGTGTIQLKLPGNGGNTIAVTSSWNRVSTSGAAGGTINYYVLEIATIGDVVEIRYPQAELGSAATPYQRVGSTFDITETGVPSVGYLAFDTDKWMVTNTITPGTDKAQMFAGVRKMADVAFGASDAAVIAEFGTSVIVTVGLAGSTGYNTGQKYGFYSKGTVAANPFTTNSIYTAPITNVISGFSDIAGDLATLRIDGTQVAQVTTDQGTGNYLAYPLYIGRRGGSSLPFNGHLYSLIVRFGSNLSAARISAAEVWVSDKTAESNFPKITSPIIYTRSEDTILDRFNSTIERRAV